MIGYLSALLYFRHFLNPRAVQICFLSVKYSAAGHTEVSYIGSACIGQSYFEISFCL